MIMINNHNHNQIIESFNALNKKIIRAKTQTKLTGVNKTNKNYKGRNTKIKNLKTENIFKEISSNNFGREEKSKENISKESALNKGRNKLNLHDSHHTNDYS